MTPFQTAAQVCAVGMGAVPLSRAGGAVSARLDGVDRDAALSWKLTAVMEQTTMEVTFLTSSITFNLFLSLFCLFYFCVSGGLSITSFCLLISPAKKSAFILLCCPSAAETPVGSLLY